jgi:endonuclease/exonuclease/phosphatase family metal-dependent hydrolase
VIRLLCFFLCVFLLLRLLQLVLFFFFCLLNRRKSQVSRKCAVLFSFFYSSFSAFSSSLVLVSVIFFFLLLFLHFSFATRTPIVISSTPRKSTFVITQLLDRKLLPAPFSFLSLFRDFFFFSNSSLKFHSTFLFSATERTFLPFSPSLQSSSLLRLLLDFHKSPTSSLRSSLFIFTERQSYLFGLQVFHFLIFFFIDFLTTTTTTTTTIAMNYGMNYYYQASMETSTSSPSSAFTRRRHHSASQEPSSSSSLRIGEPLKIVTYNVHGWEDAQGQDNFDRVLEVLTEINSDVICLQEVKEESKQFPQGGTLEALAKRLGFDFIKAVAATPDPTRWSSEMDVVLSQFPMTNKHTRSLLISPYQDRVAAIAEFSFFVQDERGNTLPTPRRIGVVSTHLDHAFEEIRLQQIEKLLAYLQEIKLEEYILTGDFNSVWKDDFSSHAWNQLVKVRMYNQWEEPRIDVIQKVTKEHGCKDSFWELQRLQFLQDSHKNRRRTTPPPLLPSLSTSASSTTPQHIQLHSSHQQKQVFSSEDSMSDQVGVVVEEVELEFKPSEWSRKPEPTVWANTRIDFIFLSKDLGMKVTSYSRLNNEASDHFPVISELQLLETSSASASASARATSPSSLSSSSPSETTSSTSSLPNSNSQSPSSFPSSSFPFSCSVNGCPSVLKLLTS